MEENHAYYNIALEKSYIYICTYCILQWWKPCYLYYSISILHWTTFFHIYIALDAVHLLSKRVHQCTLYQTKIRIST